MKPALKTLFLLGLLSLPIRIASAQVTTGTPPFGTFGGGPVDTIDLANLNSLIVIPVLQKAGRGVPLNANLIYESSIWTPVSSNGVETWVPAPAFGWSFPTIGQMQWWGGYAGYGYYWDYGTYIDPLGTPHAFPTLIIASSGGCTTSYTVQPPMDQVT